MSNAPKLWAGRFSQETDALVHRFNASLAFDSRLWPFDIQGSIAHVKMLGNCGIIPQSEAKQIADGLESLASDLQSGAAELPPDAEDVHMAVETLLTRRLGPVAGKLHTARSRNDQVATDLRLYVKEAVAGTRSAVLEVQATLAHLAESHLDTLLPGMTHLQHAQPVRLAHHLLAYFWMLARDESRLVDAGKRMDRLPLGAGALAGTTFPIDRRQVADHLGFADIVENSLDAVSDRDFALETLAALSILMMHLSRLSEELILWSAPEFGWVEMGDNVTTGSSIMPQKKNPDVAELIRGKTGRVYGDLTSLLTVMKGLPLAYNKDMQEDKEPLFDALDTAALCLSALNTLLQNTEFKPERMAASLRGDFSTATDLADYLVRQGLPFRQAHEVVGKLVGACVGREQGLEELQTEDLTAASALFSGVDAAALVSPKGSADARAADGGTGREAVETQLSKARAMIERSRESLERDIERRNEHLET
jgi:argininosuccinate lyase